MKRSIAMFVVSMLIGSSLALAEAGGQMAGKKGMMSGATGGCAGMMGQGGGMSATGAEKIIAMRQELKLTDDQVAKLRALRTEAVKDAIKRQAEIKTIRVDLRSDMEKSSPDFAAARTNTKKLSDLQLQAKLSMLSAYEKSLDVLTKEQKDTLSRHMQSMHGMMMHEKMGGAGDEGDDEETE